MALADFLAELDSLAEQASAAFQAAGCVESLEQARVQFLGAKSGRLKDVQKGLGQVDKADKPAAGKRFNEVKTQVEAALEAASARLASGQGAQQTAERFDPTVPGLRPRLGRLHPLTQTVEDLKDIMGRLGFTAVEGPEVEDEWHNFEALNIPLEHPARDPLDNFYLATAAAANGDRVTKGNVCLLRSQTSTVQIRVMEKTQPPVRIISVGRVYRPDTADATHYPMFHQIEGLLIDRGITMADLKSVLRLFAANFFGGDDVHIRFRPSFFPFTEPSVEVDMSWRGGWIEMGGAGMVDPNVLTAVGYDPEEYTGFAFGLGIERFCMQRFGVTDIRRFYDGDVRFLRQLA
jgi:phenylalanyl-tRNA synthetase alpha chain